MFGLCLVWLNLLSILSDQYHLTPHSQSDNLGDFLGTWIDRFSKHNISCYLPFFTMWVLWKARNDCIFEGKKLSVHSLIQQVIHFSQLYCPSIEKRKKPRILGPDPTLVYPCGFFDGASANCGGIGYILHLNETHSFEFAV